MKRKAKRPPKPVGDPHFKGATPEALARALMGGKPVRKREKATE